MKRHCTACENVYLCDTDYDESSTLSDIIPRRGIPRCNPINYPATEVAQSESPEEDTSDRFSRTFEHDEKNDGHCGYKRDRLRYGSPMGVVEA